MLKTFQFVDLSNDDHSDGNTCVTFDRSIISRRNDKSIGIDSLRIDSTISNFMAISITFSNAIRRWSSDDDQSKIELIDIVISIVLQILPPSIEFVLPSPLLGIANLQTVDPPWVSEVKTRVQQVALNQEEVVR